MKVVVERPVIERQNLFLSPLGDVGFWFAEPGVCDSIEVVSETPVDVYTQVPATCIKVTNYRTSPDNSAPFRLYYQQSISRAQGEVINSGGGVWVTVLGKHVGVEYVQRFLAVYGRHALTGEWVNLTGAEAQGIRSYLGAWNKDRRFISVPVPIDALRIAPYPHIYPRSWSFWFAAPLISLTEPSTGSDYYFDGSTTPPDGLFSKWLGPANRSVSVQYRREVQSLETSGVSVSRRLSWSPGSSATSITGASGVMRVRGSDG